MKIAHETTHVSEQAKQDPRKKNSNPDPVALDPRAAHNRQVFPLPKAVYIPVR